MTIFYTLKGRLALTAALLAVAIIGSACAPGGDSNGGSGLISTSLNTYSPNVTLGSVLTMLSYDTDGKHGLDIQYTEGGSSASTSFAGMVAGDPAAKFVFAGASTLYPSLSKRNDIVIVAPLGGRPILLVLRKDAMQRAGLRPDSTDQEKIQALRGMTIATGAPGSGTEATLRQLLQHFGLKPGTDTRIVNVTETAAMAAAMRQGQVDGAWTTLGVVEQSVVDGYADVLVSTSRGDLAGVFSKSPGTYLVTMRSTLEKEPDTVARMFDAITEAAALVKADPEETGNRIAHDWLPKLSEGAVLIAWNQYAPDVIVDGKMSESAFQTAARDAGVDPATVRYTDSVYEKARTPIG